jgi:4-amino-4-deoxy-L-arabinose transferase-like glycosyltransferase
MPRLQELIYQLEEGRAKRWLRFGAAGLALLLIALSYNWFCFRNMGTQEAMDCAQLARNISEGNGFTTLFVRPSSMRLLQNKSSKRAALDEAWGTPDPARLKGMHPDIANAPVYPFIIAALMKILPFDYQVDLNHRFWSSAAVRPIDDTEQISPSARFRRYQPDFLISAFNQMVLFVVVTMSYFLARRLFDFRTAVFSTVLLLGTELLWRFAVSGLSTLSLMLIFVSLIWCLVRLEEKASGPNPDRGSSETTERQVRTTAEPRQPRIENAPGSGKGELTWAALAGLIVGIGALTRYPFAWLILPVLCFILLFTGQNRVQNGFVALVCFGIVLTPWLVRNWLISGTPFGTATYAILENTVLFPGSSLQRLLEPKLDFSTMTYVKLSWLKLLSNGSQMVQNDLPRLGGSWVGGFFLVGLLVPVPQKRIRHLGYFLGLSLVVLAVAQALGQTELSVASPVINSENLLVLLLPAVWIYGTRFFYLLLDQLNLSLWIIRPVVIGVFGLVTCLPLVLSLLSASRSPTVFPPYFPPSIQSAAGFVKPDEIMMSDIPWALAWYGHARCVWLTQLKRDFFTINDHQKPIQALYLSHASSSQHFESFDQWIRAGDENWGDFIMSCLLQKQQGRPGPPPDFPLEYWQKGWPMFLLFTSREKPLNAADSLSHDDARGSGAP